MTMQSTCRMPGIEANCRIFPPMLVKTSGIVLRNLKYGESSLIVDIFSRDLGLQSYLVNGARKPRASMAASLFQVMNQLDLVVYHHDKSSLKRVKEVTPIKVYQRIPVDIRRSSIGVFLVEVIRNSLPHTEANEELYDYLSEMFTMLDESRRDLPVFALRVMLDLTRYLGFQPGEQHDPAEVYFDLQEGTYIPRIPDHAYFLSPEATRALAPLREPLGFDDMPPGMTSGLRQTLMDGLLLYSQLHLDQFREPRSRAILHQVLSS